jgi:hypothetical protein
MAAVVEAGRALRAVLHPASPLRRRSRSIGGAVNSRSGYFFAASFSSASYWA